MIYRFFSGATVAAALILFSFPSFAADAALNGADTAWILTATALVLFMTLPGLAMFYGGLVRSNNVLSVLMHCFAIACLASIIWVIGGYALAFGDGGAANGWIGGFGKSFLAGIDADTLFGDIPETVFFMFQMTFAIITPALMLGAFVERIKFSAVLIFCAVWIVVVYAPVAHWVWGGGWLSGANWLTGSAVMDFAGGLVVHVTAGVSALVAALMIKPRAGFPSDVSPPHSPGLTMIGASMLWVGWFGFNAGSALAANGSAGMAMMVTHISAATGSLVWMVIEWRKYGKPSLIGIVTGMVAGLASITPASGFVGPIGALIIGLVGGLVCYWVTSAMKMKWRIDDSLDVFAVHGVGGMIGIVLTAFLATGQFGGAGLADGVSVGTQLWTQIAGVLVTLIWAASLSYIILKVIDKTIGLRVSLEDETEGLDITAHGERGYHM